MQDSIAVPAVMAAVVNQPNAHTQKYDRQLRLWASSGQTALENCRILAVGGDVTITQTLKNLVLPGIGSYTILSDALVTASDIGANFFLTTSSLGKSLAEELVVNLSELNDSVKGHSLRTPLATILATAPESLTQFDLILTSNLSPVEERQLAALAWSKSIDYIKVRNSGFFSMVTTQIKELPVVETHVSDLIDLRLLFPFPELLAFAEEFVYEGMSSMDHGHVPAVIILVKGLKEWKNAHNSLAPQNYAERKEFLSFIRSKKTSSDEENFDEAENLYRRAGVKPKIPKEMEDLLKDPSCVNLTAQSPNFFVLLHTLALFVQKSQDNLLPLSGVLPDMKASSSQYVTLQSLFKAKARSDLALFKEILVGVLAGLSGGAASNGAGRSIGDEEIEVFVKNSGSLMLVRGRSFEDETTKNLMHGQIDALLEAASESVDEAVKSNILPIYLAFLSSDKFFEKFNRYPGSAIDDSDDATDLIEFKTVLTSVLVSLGGSGSTSEDVENVMGEFVRSANRELPQIASLTGGIISQEAIKLITRQYVPTVGNCVYDGIKGVCGVVVG